MTFLQRALSKKGTPFKNLGSLRSQLGGMGEWGLNKISCFVILQTIKEVT
jgi:hypothetical protein